MLLVDGLSLSGDARSRRIFCSQDTYRVSKIPCLTLFLLHFLVGFPVDAPGGGSLTASPTAPHCRVPVDGEEPVTPGEFNKGYGSSNGPHVSKSPSRLPVSRPLLSPSKTQDSKEDASDDALDPDHLWLTNLLEWHQMTLSKNQLSSGGRKSKFKRPREVPVFPDFGDTNPRPAVKRPHLETEENMFIDNGHLDHMEAKVDIPVEQKQWMLTVNLSGGRCLRAVKKRRRDGELDSWSKTPASTIPMYGDFRSESVEKPDLLLSAQSRSVTTTWKAVLAAAKAFDKNLSEVRLDTLLDFFDHVRRLPHPGQVLDETTRIAPSVNEYLSRLWKYCTEARELRAKWTDLWFEDGVEIDAIRKALKAVTPLVPNEYEELDRQLTVVSEWQTRLNDALAAAAEDDPDCTRNDLVVLEPLALEAKQSHGFRCKGYTMLRSKLQKVYELREKLKAWKEDTTASSTVKTIAGMVREVQRLKIRFPEANELILFSQEIDSWVERADIAIRSRMSLDEVEDLIERGLKYHLDLSEYLEKLQSRVKQAKLWLANVREVVSLESTKLEFMARVREKLDQGMIAELHDLACEGSRLPVEVDFVQMIHVELDARQWSTKAEKWLPSPGEKFEPSKRGKIEELREHLKKAASLRERLAPSDRAAWPLRFESQLGDVVGKANAWFENEYDVYFDGDNRRTTSRRNVSIAKLRQIDENADAIPVNLGLAKVKVDRYLVQAETWYGTHQKLLVDAGLKSSDLTESSNTEYVSLEQLKLAMDDANSGIAFDLEEVDQLSSLIEKSEVWFDQVSIATATGKRRVRGKKSTYTIDELKALKEEASDLPMDTREAVAAITERINTVSEWQSGVVTELAIVMKELIALTDSLDQKYGSPKTFSRTAFALSAKDERLPDSAADPDEGMDLSTDDAWRSGEIPVKSLEDLVHKLVQEISFTSVTTPEMTVIANLDTLLRWISRSIKYLYDNDEIFDKRFYGAFDRFVSEGEDLEKAFSQQDDLNNGLSEMNKTCCRTVGAQLCRVRILLQERDDFSSWSDQVDRVLSGEDKRCSVEKLRELNMKSQKFPAENDHVKKVRDLTERTDAWIEIAKNTIDSEERLKMADLKMHIDEGDKLGIACPELRELKAGLKAAKNWANRVKKCKPELCVADMSDINALVDDYESLLVEMPDEIARLNQAIKHYCICRGPYDGQMISCEECGDMFHASCLGMSKSRAEKIDKYTCIRCSVKKMFRTSSTTVASIVKKWTCDKELHKARQIEVQKYQRKSRKESKDIEKHQNTAADAARSLAELDPKSDMRKVQDVTHPISDLGESEPIEDPTSMQCDNYKSTEIFDLSQVPPASVSRALNAESSSPDPATTAQSLESSVEKVEPKIEQTLEETSTTKSRHASTTESPKADDPDQEQASFDASATIAPDSGEDGVEQAARSVLVTGSTAAVGDVLKSDELSFRRQELRTKYEKSMKAIDACRARLQALETADEDRKKRELLENSQAAEIQKWSIVVRRILAPCTQDDVSTGRPGTDGELSPAMRLVLSEAQNLGVASHKDVAIVENAFGSMCWCRRALELLRRRPKADDLSALVLQAERINLPEEKSLKFLRAVSQRVESWNTRFRKVLAPLPGEVKNIDMKELKDLATAADKLPVALSYEHRLETAMEDDGTRYCVCGGPSDGRFMVGCDKCDKWYHGCCTGVKAEDELDNWFCPPCAGLDIDPRPLIEKFHDSYDSELVEDVEDDDVASKAPDPETLWPPFGLKDNPEVLDAMGMEVFLLPEESPTKGSNHDVALVASSSSENAGAVMKDADPEQLVEQLEENLQSIPDLRRSAFPEANPNEGEDIPDYVVDEDKQQSGDKMQEMVANEPKTEPMGLVENAPIGDRAAENSGAEVVDMDIVSDQMENDTESLKSGTADVSSDRVTSSPRQLGSDSLMSVGADAQGEVPPVAS